MNGRKLFRGTIWMILTALLLAGCSAPADTSTVEITFDGNECAVSGPAEYPVGENPFILKNLTEDTLSLQVNRFLDGHKFQELVDMCGKKCKGHESGPTWPDWLYQRGTRYVDCEKNAETGEEISTLEIMQVGDWAISIINTSTSEFWPCAPLKVVEAPSE